MKAQIYKNLSTPLEFYGDLARIEYSKEIEVTFYDEISTNVVDFRGPLDIKTDYGFFHVVCTQWDYIAEYNTKALNAYAAKIVVFDWGLH